MSNTWADSVLEPEPDDGEDGDAGMTIIPPAPQEAVGVMPEPTPVPVPAAPAKKKITWQDFPIEDHVRAFLGVPADSKLSLGKVGKNKYRANIYSPSKKGLVVDYSITDSAYLDIATGPNGYVIVNESEGEFKKAAAGEKRKKW